MKAKSILFFIILFISGHVHGQRWKLSRYEVHFGIGSTNVYGDIGGTDSKDNLYGLKDIRISETRYSLYLATSYKIRQDMALKFNLIYGRGYSNDLNSKNEGRGYSFNTSIFEPSLEYEYYFLKEERRLRGENLFNRRRMVNNYSVLGAYVFTGIGGALFWPRVTVNSNYNPAKETISGYSKFTPVIPIGIGLKYSIDKSWSVGFEFGKRFAFTDYLDGISTIYSKANDTYYFGVFHAIYHLRTNWQGAPIIFGKPLYKRR